MTIREFYEWAVEHGYEDYEMGNYYYSGYGEMTIDCFEINEELERVATEFEC